MDSHSSYGTHDTHNVTEPISNAELLDLVNEAAREPLPDAMRAYVPLNGLVFDGAVDRPRIGLTRLEMGAGSAVWAITMSDAYRWGLPVRRKMRVDEARRRTSAMAVSVAEAVHLPWNANVYHPALATRPERLVHRPNGRRATPTDSIDALIFNSDDRKAYYPKGYPWHCVGKLDIQADGVGSSGSGALVGRDLVLTARHAVPWEARNLSMKFTPAFYENASIIGPSFYSWVESATAYEGSDVGAWDFALLRLYQPLGDYLGFFGVRTYDDSWDDKPFWTAAGYPGMSPFDGKYPAYLQGIEIDDADSDGDADELESENQDNSKGASGGPLWARWPNGPYIVGVVSANEKVDYGLWTDYQVLNASGKAMVDLVALARLEINTDIHVNPPHLDFGG